MTAQAEAEPSTLERLGEGRGEPLPNELGGIGVNEQLKNAVPADLRFKDASGEDVRLGDVLGSETPTLLTMNYTDCPMLCSIQLDGLVRGLKEMEWTLGQQFNVVTVSLDPLETPEKAKRTKERYLKQYGRATSDQGWQFLTGDEASIRALAESIGFNYRYSERRKEYLHAAVVTVLNQEQRVSRYLYGVMYDARTLRLSLAEASDGRYVSAIDRAILFCYHYDATVGRYAPLAFRMMQIGALATVMVLGSFLGGYWATEYRRHKVA